MRPLDRKWVGSSVCSKEGKGKEGKGRGRSTPLQGNTVYISLGGSTDLADLVERHIHLLPQVMLHLSPQLLLLLTEVPQSFLTTHQTATAAAAAAAAATAAAATAATAAAATAAAATAAAATPVHRGRERRERRRRWGGGGTEHN